MGSAIKYWIAYPAPFWRDAGFNGSVFRDDVPCSPCFDVTPPGAEIGLIAGFFDATIGEKLVGDRGQRLEVAVPDPVMKGNDACRRPLHVFERHRLTVDTNPLADRIDVR